MWIGYRVGSDSAEVLQEPGVAATERRDCPQLITSGGQSALGAVEHANRAVVFIVDLIKESPTARSYGRHGRSPPPSVSRRTRRRRDALCVP